MKKHNTFKVVLIALIVILVLSWIFPAAYFSSEYVDQGRAQMGLADANNYFMTALSYFGHIALYLILVGCFYGILYKIPAYRTFLDKIVAKVNSKVFLVVTVLLLAFGVSIAGLQVGYAIFIPFIIALILLMGYDKIVAALVVVGSMAAGLVGSTFAVSNNNMLTSILGLDYNYQIGVRFIILLVAIVLVLFNLFMYIKRNLGEVTVKKATKKEEKKEEVVVARKIELEEKPKKKSSNTKSTKTTSSKSTKSTKKKSTRKNANKAALREEDIIVVKESVKGSDDEKYLVPTRVEVTHRVWPFVVGFILLFILLVISMITWSEGGFGVTVFDKVTESVKNFKLFGFPIFDTLYGTESLHAFGTWTLIDMFFPIILLLIILIFIYKVKFDDVLDGAAAGAKKALFPAFIAIMLYTVLVAATYHPFQLSIYKAILGLAKGFNVGTTVVVTLLASIINIDPAYVYQALLPYYASVVTNVENFSMSGIIAQSMYGLSALFAPTSLILMCTLAYLRVSYKDWLKNIWKLLLELFIVLLIVFIVLALV